METDVRVVLSCEDSKGENGSATPVTPCACHKDETDYSDLDADSDAQCEANCETESLTALPRNLESDSRMSQSHGIMTRDSIKSLTFEDHFRKPSVQREFIANVLTLQVWMNLSSFLTSCLCTFLSDQIWFWEAGADLLNALILHTVILLTLTLVYPFLASRLNKSQEYSGMMMKVVIDTILRIYHSAVLTFWVSLLLGKIWKSRNIIEDEGISGDLLFTSVPLFFVVALYYGLNLVNHVGIITCLRHTKMEVSIKNMCFLSFAFSGISLFIVFLLILNIGRSLFINWDIWQALCAALFTSIDGSFIMCSFRNKPSPQDVNSKSEEGAYSEAEVDVP